MKIFVSYTLRDGSLNLDKLASLEKLFNVYGEVYIDKLHNNSNLPQAYVINKIHSCDIVFACLTDGFFLSEWTQLEISIARKHGIPILYLHGILDIINQKRLELF